MAVLKKLTKKDEESIRLLKLFYEKVVNAFNVETFKITNQDSFHCIPYYNSRLIEHLMQLFKSIKDPSSNENPTFLDVGCGIGHIVSLASIIGFNAKGLEYIIPRNHANINIIEADALKFREYKNYDVIYCYQIFKNPSKLKELYDLIVKKAKIGAYILPVGQHYRSSFANCECVELNHYRVYLKK